MILGELEWRLCANPEPLSAVTYINVEMETLKSACVAMLRAGLPIFFGSDVGKFSDRVSGIMDLDVIDYELGFNLSLLGMGKADRLRAGESQMSTCAQLLPLLSLSPGFGFAETR